MQSVACQRAPAAGLIPLTPSSRFHDDVRETFKDRVRRLLAERGMTQEEFARRTTASMRTVTGWLAGSHPDARFIEEISQALDVTLDDLLRDIDWGRPEPPANSTEAERGAADARQLVDRARRRARSGTQRRRTQGQDPPQSA